MQGYLGYTATIAGEALTGGGIALLFVMPLAGWATSRFAARNLVAVGFTFFALAFYYVSTHTDLTISFGENTFLRIILMIPIPFCFISITNAAYVGLPREASNQVSGIINFVRNVGGSIFIAVTGAIVTNRTLFHEARLQNGMQFGSVAYQQQMHSLTGFFSGIAGNSGQTASGLARASIYNQLNQQAAAMGYQGHLSHALLDGRRHDRRSLYAQQEPPGRRRAPPARPSTKSLTYLNLVILGEVRRQPDAVEGPAHTAGAPTSLRAFAHACWPPR